MIHSNNKTKVKSYLKSCNFILTVDLSQLEKVGSKHREYNRPCNATKDKNNKKVKQQ